MKTVYGDTKSLKPSQKVLLEKLGTRRCHPNEVLSSELAKSAAEAVAQLGLQLGLLIGRDGRVFQVVLGARDRIYLPDLGRFRLNSARLRRLRLLVFLPVGQHNLRRFPKQAFATSDGGQTATHRSLKHSGEQGVNELATVNSPEIAVDLLTDLEKLRFDLVGVVAVGSAGQVGQMSIAYLQPSDPGSKSHNAHALQSYRERGVRFYHVENLSTLDIDFTTFVKDLENSFGRVKVSTKKHGDVQAVLVGAYTGRVEEAQSSMDELMELARSADIEVLDCIIQRRRSLDPKTLIGKGKIEQLVLHCLDLGAELLIFDRELSPGQLRSITNLTELKVLDRSMLILDIFSQRAKSSEGRVQVELAQLKYSLPRLTEHDTGLSRLSGGIGGRGPGETKLEIGRRRARDRITELEKKIKKLSAQRGLRRERRQSRGVPVVAIVGYTNAGKSTLLNSLTKGSVLAESRMFATLDPASRRMRFPNEKELVIVDTVGFIRELPKELVNAFRATLEEVGEADLLLHVGDATNRELPKQIEVVDETLKALGFDQSPRILVLNKTDLLSALEIRSLENTLGGLGVSSLKRDGLVNLISLMQQRLADVFLGQDPGRFTETPYWEQIDQD